MKKKDKLWERVRKEFPDDPALQEVHYARLKIREETKGMSTKEYIAYIKSIAKESLDKKNTKKNNNKIKLKVQRKSS